MFISKGTAVMRQRAAVCIGVSVGLASALWTEHAGAQAPRPDVTRATLRVETLPSTQAPRFFEPKVIEAQIEYAMRSNPRLQGAYLHFDLVKSPTDPDGPATEFLIYRTLDRGRAAAQRQELDKFVANWFPAGHYRVVKEGDREYPFSELFGQMQDWIEARADLQGCLIAGGYLKSTTQQRDAALELRLTGRYAGGNQNDRIEATCGELMRLNPIWVRPSPQGPGLSSASQADPVDSFKQTVLLQISPNVSELVEVPPSDEQGRWFYSQGMNLYFQGRFHDAAAVFRRAAVESPSKLEYQYWRVLCELAAGDSQRAYNHLRAVVRIHGVDPQTSQYQRVIHSLERVQGPLRLELMRLEAQAVREVSRATLGGSSSPLPPQPPTSET